ncbi:hypothetical protein CEXT_456901 [Caerostris extrusa]|uniref:Uncharacterized protein n=1 Tax=Caerostris extrusa TaxID=172846 RepID=A0AAV4MJH8_CAEEX|nr:hypothetical protein CEXT_456901 [Caerostris extrusa]
MAELQNEYHLLHEAVRAGHRVIGANQKVKDKEGRTPLHLAVVSKNIEMVETLLNAEADALLKENNKKSATERRSVNHRLDAVKC